MLEPVRLPKAGDRVGRFRGAIGYTYSDMFGSLLIPVPVSANPAGLSRAVFAWLPALPGEAPIVSNLSHLPDARADLARRGFSEAPSSERLGLAVPAREMRAPPLT